MSSMVRVNRAAYVISEKFHMPDFYVNSGGPGNLPISGNNDLGDDQSALCADDYDRYCLANQSAAA